MVNLIFNKIKLIGTAFLLLTCMVTIEAQTCNGLLINLQPPTNNSNNSFIGMLNIDDFSVTTLHNGAQCVTNLYYMNTTDTVSHQITVVVYNNKVPVGIAGFQFNPTRDVNVSKNGYLTVRHVDSSLSASAANLSAKIQIK